MKKPKKYTTPWGHQMTLTVDENLNKLKGANPVPQKLKEVNERLRNMKDPKIIPAKSPKPY